MLMLVLEALQRDLLRLPEESRDLAMGMHQMEDEAELQAAHVLRQQYSRALQVSFCKSGSIPGLLLRTLLQPNDDVQLDDCTGLIADLVARERRAVLNGKRQQQKLGAATAGSAAAANLGAAADRLSLDRYALVCLADPSCRYSLTCWVLAWHAALAQQGGHYDSAASR
ncbi:hypothetical protein OEZ85_002621 [Tetradesmus obliquus]|uniref:Uncharacterized protein n=1 Tax=Tetradesmus obliquus TaxID=3088 RepID=A0ABY8TY34_TETOB|nr:hypothetical protein OEZ85_002621 [Tetradesmus obliquus]